MKSFAIDLYLWFSPFESVGDWLYVPPYPGSVTWPGELSQSEILSYDAGITFRVDNVLWLGQERDSFPLQLIVFELERSLVLDTTVGQILAEFTVSESLAVKIKQGTNNQALLSRNKEREEQGYLDRVAQAVGVYFRDFAVDQHLWRSAVNRTLDGLAVAFALSPPSKTPFEANDLARYLMGRYQSLKQER